MLKFFNSLLSVLLICLMLFIAGCQIEENIPEQMGKVTFKGLMVDDFSQTFDNSRLSATSSWNHLYAPNATIEFQNVNSGQKYSMTYEPANFYKSFSINLPFGEYTFTSVVKGELVSPFLPYSVEGSLEVNQENQEVVLQVNTDYGLITLRNELVEEVTVKVEGLDQAMYLLGDGSYHYAYIQGGQTANLSVVESYGNSTIEKVISVQPYLHRNFLLEITEGVLNGLELVMDVFVLVEEVIVINDDVVLPSWFNPNKTYGILTDNDGNLYRTIQIGTQVWMAENLKTTKYCNGDEIPEAASNLEWSEASGGRWSYYDNNLNYNEVYGKLYNQETVIDYRGVCPCGWRVPTKEDWETMFSFVDELGPYPGGFMKSTGTEFWKAPNDGATNSSGFSALPAGERLFDGGFVDLGERASWWAIFPTNLRRYFLTYDLDWGYVTSGHGGFSIRCIKE